MIDIEINYSSFNVAVIGRDVIADAAAAEVGGANAMTGPDDMVADPLDIPIEKLSSP
jgi:hypothetical protein